MQRLLPILCLLCLLQLSPHTAFAQPKHSLSLRYNALNYVTPRLAGQNLGNAYADTDGYGLEVEYARRIAPKTYLAFPLKIGKGRVADNSRGAGEDKIIGNLDLLLHYNFLKHDVFLNPSIHFGAGAGWYPEDENLDVNLPMGLGLNFRLSERVHLSAQTQYRFAGGKRAGWQHGLGLTQYLGTDDTKDGDKDGVPDVTDRCPEVPGLITMLGCPDRDSDGVTDAEDKCPDVAGIMAMLGCPDRDNDGLTDLEDKCPDVAGLMAMLGCPDTDSDGITDTEDKCPREAGPASNMGCPIVDRDGDGVVDADDLCPTDKGPANTKGCPDRDLDGLADKDDVCPDKKGDVAHYGCPDTDGDGVYDNEDRCITVAGPATNRGCPEIKKEDRAKVELAVKAVQFESGKSVLLKQSFKVLDDVATVLQKYPYYSLDMKGHTDSQGEAPMNLDLSKRRAKTCYDYLISKGVKASQITSEGFGETVPIGDNMNAAGRAKNRRVEFDLIVK